MLHELNIQLKSQFAKAGTQRLEEALYTAFSKILSISGKVSQIFKAQEAERKITVKHVLSPKAPLLSVEHVPHANPTQVIDESRTRYLNLRFRQSIRRVIHVFAFLLAISLRNDSSRSPRGQFAVSYFALGDRERFIAWRLSAAGDWYELNDDAVLLAILDNLL